MYYKGIQEFSNVGQLSIMFEHKSGYELWTLFRLNVILLRINENEERSPGNNIFLLTYLGWWYTALCSDFRSKNRHQLYKVSLINLRKYKPNLASLFCQSIRLFS